MNTTETPLPHDWAHHLADEADAAFLYRELAHLERDPAKAELYGRLAAVEDRHVAVWSELIRAQGHPVPPTRISGRARLQAWLARRFGPGLLAPMLLEEEGKEVKGYLDLYRQAPNGAAAPTALLLARESAEHAESLAGLVGRSAEPWHKTGAGGMLRNLVYGFNDGLTANFGLVAGMLGAQGELNLSGHAVIVAGVAGMVADALSMGSSGYLAAKSEREVQEHEIAMERDEIRLMPDLEREELSLLYQAKGIPTAQADELAASVMQDPERALQEKVREELQISPPDSTPMREAWITGTATAVGAFIPVAPFLVTTGPVAIWTSFVLSMLAHFAVGAARSIFTGRGIVRSGFDMFVVGLGVAVVGYFVGEWITTLL
ncbi:MAG TPA: VIT1/CCC1 transporter family protein [Gemmatimonadales bacterium]|nr:VIT1/CCC1 transporter family protein [Gemmatimonadales bacterium]